MGQGVNQSSVVEVKQMSYYAMSCGRQTGKVNDSVTQDLHTPA